MKRLLTLLTLALVFCATAKENKSPSFEQFRMNPKDAILPDYSWAGYRFGAEGIPDVEGRIFNVADYGALPNDDKEDFDGIQAAIKAAEATGGGIVFFPSGKFLVNETEGRRIGIEITKPNIILRGSGATEGGTELFMRHYMLPRDPEKLWTVPYLFTFKGSGSNTVRTTVAANAKRGDTIILVDDASLLKAGDVITLKMQNPDANDEFLANLKTWDNWGVTNEKGVAVNEYHKIASVHENRLLLCEPLNTNITASYGFSVVTSTLWHGWGVEDIWFRGNFHDKIIHHKDFIHDGGWSFIRMERAENAWVRRLRISDAACGVMVNNSYACSVIQVRFDGNPGHCTISAEHSYGILTGLIHDASDYPGMWHGPCFAGCTNGSVIWRYEGQAQSGPDFHASWPYCNLIDASTSKYIGNGGNVDLLPNHMKDLTYWNHKEIGTYENIDFWEPQLYKDSDSRQLREYGRFVKLVKPNLIGYHGGGSTFKRESLNIYESPGKPVTPESLYEAQLELRLGELPQWIIQAKKEWMEYLHRSTK